MFPQQSPFDAYRSPQALVGTTKVAFLRKVYGLLTTSIIAAAVGALFALHAGASASQVTIDAGDGVVASVPPLVVLLSSSWIAMLIGFFVMFGAFMGASAVRRKPVVNVIALHGAAFISGVYLAPAIFVATVMASTGHTLSPAPVRDAFLLASGGFAGLSAYTLVSKRDFSFLGGFLSIGFFVVLGGVILAMFVHSNVFQLAIASAGVLLFGAYILYDTSKLIRQGTEDAIGATIRLYLDFLNLFIFLLRILGSRRD